MDWRGLMKKRLGELDNNECYAKFCKLNVNIFNQKEDKRYVEIRLDMRRRIGF